MSATSQSKEGETKAPVGGAPLPAQSDELAETKADILKVKGDMKTLEGGDRNYLSNATWLELHKRLTGLEARRDRLESQRAPEGARTSLLIALRILWS